MPSPLPLQVLAILSAPGRDFDAGMAPALVFDKHRGVWRVPGDQKQQGGTLPEQMPSDGGDNMVGADSRWRWNIFRRQMG